MVSALEARIRHYFPEHLEGAAERQRAWAREIEECPLPRAPRLVAGADLSYDAANGTLAAAVVVLERGRADPVESSLFEGRLSVPYVPGFLSFREGPAILRALARLKTRPELLICDGHGRAHPRRFGLACHVGLATGIPTVGVGKSLLVGTHRALASKRGSRARLVHRDEVVGMALRTRSGVRPVYVSIGHRVDLASALRAVLAWAKPFRLPEPQRLADLRVTRWRRSDG